MNVNVSNVVSEIEKSVTAYHAVCTAKEKLEKCGFKKYDFGDKIEKGSKYFITRDDSSIIAFIVGKDFSEEENGFNIVVTHNDSPGFKLKYNPEIYDEGLGVTKLNVESYGGGIWHTWLDRELGVAGRVVVNYNNKLVKEVMELDKTFVIPSLAIHIERSVNEGKKFNLQNEMMPVIYEKLNVKEEIASAISQKRKCYVLPDDVFGYDLFLYSKSKSFSSGDVFSCPRIDNLISTFSAIESLCSEKVEKSNSIKMIAAFDNEEVGSLSYAGASSTFLSEVLEQITSQLECKNVKRVYDNSLIISLDGAHGMHPNYKEKSDPTNKVVLNCGPVIKQHASKHYATDGIGSSVIKYISNEVGVPLQYFFNRSDIPSGSTIGTLLFQNIGIRVVDMGIAQLAMHSIVETAGIKDVEDTIKLLATFFKTEIKNCGDSLEINIVND